LEDSGIGCPQACANRGRRTWCDHTAKLLTLLQLVEQRVTKRELMKSGEETLASPVIAAGIGPWATWRGLPRPERMRIGGGVGWIVVVTLVFVQPLTRLMLHASRSELHSYIPLVPFIAGYLFYIQRGASPAAYRSSIGGTLMTGAIGFAALGGGIWLRESLSVNDDLALMTLAYVSLIAAGGLLFLGSKWMAAAAFPVAFLMFMVPLPDGVVNWLETASVLASADVAALFFNMTGTPLLRDGTVFALPTIVLRVAQECSGIHSSWVLFITSLLASDLFLESPWRRILLVAFVIPLGIVRNGFRILVIGLLCVHVGPHMIDSIIHRRGGPFFFVLSLVPLILFMAWLRRQEQR
jgi:exosortase C (VPDSG-CTERM-specific)